MKLSPGMMFNTRFETNCEVITEPDADGNFMAFDSDGVECQFSLCMVLVPKKVYRQPSPYSN